jgi:superfamily II DNA or RNA helicase
MNEKGYIYIRNHDSYNEFNVYKLGKASNLLERENGYITGEVKRGKFILVLEMDRNKIHFIEKILKNYFSMYHFYIDAGTELFKRDILEQVVPFLKEHTTLDFTILSESEILTLSRTKRNIVKPKAKTILTIYKKLYPKDIIPSKHQQDILDTIEDFYTKNTIGKLLWACGLGKTLMSLLICKKLKFKTIVIGVPSIYLQNQFYEEILKVFPNKDAILRIGGDEDDKVNLHNFYKDKSALNTYDSKIILTTYASCHNLVHENLVFDFKIGDEVHHLTGMKTLSELEDSKTYLQFHQIKSNKSLYLTATEKNLEDEDNYSEKDASSEKYTNFSMNNKDVFGELIDKKSVYWAIENEKITDYNLLLIANQEKEVDTILCQIKDSLSLYNKINKDLFIAAFISLKSIEKYEDLTHIVLYTNTIDNANLVKGYIDAILNTNLITIDKSKFYNESIHSANKKNLGSFASKVEEFRDSTYGIISCVYIFGEGFDLPKLNGVTFAENMSSYIRIVQSALRPHRKEKGNPNKKAYIILPYVEDVDGVENVKSFEKCREVISKLGNEDEILEQRIKVCRFDKEKRKDSVGNNTDEIYNFILNENHQELEKIKLKLKYRKLLKSDFSEEENEYNYVKGINKTLNLVCIKKYKESQSIHSYYIPDPESYFRSKGVWKGLYDFLGYNTSVFIQSKESWKQKCIELGITSIDDYNQKSELYSYLPKSPGDFYKKFSNIPNELSFNENRRR